ncbi:MAG: hypothetical protein M0Z53_01895 [Thermaerobacter sp.]|nr:hypothetical protein [Thermaerobacter sp.]
MNVNDELTWEGSDACIQVAVAEPHGSRLAQILRDQVPGLATARPASDEPGDGRGWVLVTPDRVAWARQAWPPDRIGVIAGTAVPDPRWAAQGLHVLTGVLPWPVVEWARTRGAPETSLAWDETDGAVGPAAPPVPALRAPTGRGPLVAVYSSGGGVGKTTTAVYLATVAAAQRQTVGVVELDEDRRGILTYWNRPLQGGGLDSITPHVWTDPARLAQDLARILVPVDARLRVVPMAGTLTGLQYPVEATDQAVRYLTEWARQQFACTIFDLSARIRESTPIAVLQAVDRVIWVMEPTEIMLDSSRGYLDLLEQLGDGARRILPKIGLVVNKVEKARTARLDPPALADALGLPLWGTVASNPAKYMSGINQHRVDPTPEWLAVARAVGLVTGDAPRPAGKARRAWWRRLS